MTTSTAVSTDMGIHCFDQNNDSRVYFNQVLTVTSPGLPQAPGAQTDIGGYTIAGLNRFVNCEIACVLSFTGAALSTQDRGMISRYLNNYYSLGLVI
jgi:hypothetical protein